jgi:hypothetical protein
VSAWLFRQPLERAVPKALAALASAYALVAFAYVSFKRVRFPYDLEWMEGGSLVHVERVLRGAPLYTPPSLDWTPYIYTPLYWYVSAGFAKVVGLTLFAPRLVSIISTGVTLLAISATVRRDGSRLSAFLAAGLFAATFRASGAWFDLARTDMLACAFGSTAIWLLGGKAPSSARSSISGLLLACAVLSKQTWLAAACAIVVASALEAPRRMAALLPSFVAPLVSFWSIAHVSTDGWSTYYTLLLPFQHSAVDGGLATFLFHDLSRNFGPTTCLAVAAFVLIPRDERRFFAIVTMGCLGAALSARLHSGAYDNVLIPAYASLSMIAGRAVARVERIAERTGAATTLAVLVLTAVIVQVASLNYDVKAELPTRQDRIAGRRLVQKLAAQSGEVLVPNHAGLCVAAKKPCHAHWMAMHDVLRGQKKRPQELLLDSMNRALASGRITMVVTDDTFGGELVPLVDKHYPKRTPFADPKGPIPKTGFITTPTELRTR